MSVSFEEQKMSKHKYLSIFLPQMGLFHFSDIPKIYLRHFIQSPDAFGPIA